MRAAKELLRDLSYEVLSGDADTVVSGLAYHTGKITCGCMFVCIKGTAFDSHDAAEKAVGAGAAVIVAEHPVRVPGNVTLILVSDTRYALALISAAWFGYPAERLRIIGVTGTKGKTTVTFLIRSILERAGIRAGLIGTIETIIGDTHIPAGNTTPESYTLHETFAKMAEEGCKAVVMEVSSQGLKLCRTAGISFEIGIFTNLASDHIGPGEHEDFEEYIACKSRLFRQCRTGIVNIDDRYCGQVLKGHTCQVETYGFSKEAGLRASEIRLVSGSGSLGVSCHMSGTVDFDMEIDIPGKFSVYNSLAAVAACRHFGVSPADMAAALKAARIRGRIEKVPVSDDFTLFIDYAHNAMSLESLLTTLREYHPARLICLFGCGGNRSRARRFEMGEVSGRLADLTVITSDNPRFEEPQKILDDIRTGIERTDGEYVEMIDRKEAIRYCIEQGKPGDVIVLAGKGHEDYQEIKGIKYPMDERVLIREILQEMEKG